MFRLISTLLLALSASAVASADTWVPHPVDTRHLAGSSLELHPGPGGTPPRIAYWTPGSSVLGYGVFGAAGWQVEDVPLSTAPAGAVRAHDPAAASLLITVETHLAIDPAGEPWISSIRHDCFGDCSGPVLVTHRENGDWITEALEPTSSAHGITVSPQGVVTVAYVRPGGIVAARRKGGSWTYEQVAPPGVVHQVLTGADGEPRMLLSGAGPTGLQVATRKAGLWQLHDVPDPAAGTGSASFALTTDGRVHIARTLPLANPSARALWYQEEQPGGWLSEPVTVAGDSVEIPALTLGPGGDPRIAFRDLAPSPFRVRLARRAAGTWSVEDVDATLPSNGALHAIIDGGGTTWVAFAAGSYGLHSASAVARVDAPMPAPPDAFAIGPAGAHPARAGAGLHLAIWSPSARVATVDAFDLHGRRLASSGPRTVQPGVNRLHLSVPPRAGVVLVRAVTDAGDHATARIVLLEQSLP